jgi:signal transduction histidine kinase
VKVKTDRKEKKVKLKISLYARFMTAVTFILIVLVGSILFVIQQREVRTIIDGAKESGILIARNIAYLNLEMLKFYDITGVKKNIDGETDENLLYVVFYDRYRNLFVASDLVKDNEEIIRYSRLPVKVSAESSFIESGTFRKDNKNVPIIDIEIPIFAAGSPDYWGSVKVGLSLEDMQVEIRKTRLVLILIGCGGFFLGLIGSGLLAKRITGPLKKLLEGTVRISRGDFSQSIKITSQDEIGDLARSFNEMTHDLLRTRKKMEEANKKLVQAEKLASIGRIAATIAHEIRNPLTSVKLNIQKVLQNEALGGEEKEHLNISQEGIIQIEKFIKELLNFTRVSDLNRERFSVEQILEEAIKMMHRSFEEKGIILERDYAKKLPLVFVDGDKMRQVFLNILRNAAEALDEGGRISLTLSLTHEDGARKITVRISDDGCGIPEKDWENIFEPFYTTKPSGFGLGLSNARKIVEQHNGSIKVVEKQGKGTSFKVRIPCEGEK